MEESPSLGQLVGEVSVIALLVAINGWLALTEMALTSSNKTRLSRLAADGSAGARRALDLLARPTEVLAGIQVGITLIGVAAGAFGGATFARALAAVIVRADARLAPWAGAAAFAVVVTLITALSLLFGELIPKRLALADPEMRAARAARPLARLLALTGPVARLLARTTEGLLHVLKHRDPPKPPVTGDEVRLLVDQGTAAGVFDPSESTMIKRVLRLDDLRVDAIMTPRVKVVGLDLDDDPKVSIERVVTGRHAYFPLYRGEWNDLAGIVAAKDVVAALLAGGTVDLKACAREPLYFAKSVSVARALDKFKQSSTHAALVIDEFGTVAGLLTLTDTLEAVVGELPDAGDSEPEVLRREDGTWLIDGRYPLRALPDVLPVRTRAIESLDARTIGGLVMAQLGRIPREGDRFFWEGYRFEVVDMDGRRVDKVLVGKATARDKASARPSQLSDLVTQRPR